MIDLYLRAGNADDLASACPWLHGEDGNGERIWLTSGEGFAFDPIGVLVLDPGTYDDEGAEITLPIFAEGWHGNLRCTEEVATRVPPAIMVEPNNPRRVWA